VHSLVYRYRIWLALIFGLLLPLAFAPFGVWVVAIVSPAGLFICWKGISPRSAAAVGFWYGMGAFGAGTYWLYNSIYTIGHAPMALTLLMMLGMAALMASYFTVCGYLQARMLPTDGLVRYLMGLPAMWLLCEWWRGWFVSGFPWMSLGYSQIDTPLAGFAPVAGVYGISLACALMSGAVALMIVGSRRQQVVSALFLLLPWMVSWPLWNRVWTQPVRSPVTVAVVQGAVAQELKWSQAWRDKTLQLYYDLTAPYFGTQLIVWPEAALPDPSSELLDYLSPLWSEAHSKNSDLIMGLLHDDPREQKIYNGVLSLSDDVQWYHKAHLVPFGEYFPVPDSVRQWMRMMSLPYHDITQGDAVQKPLTAAGEKISASVCYEDGFGTEQLYALREATLMVNVTNDAWFGNSIAAPQHLEISRMRALEAGRDLVRAANDGISAIIGSDGKLRAHLPRFKPAVLTGTVQPREGLTPYARTGNWPVLILSFAMMFLSTIIRRLQSKTTQSSPVTP
jgi:apolipoprotein N-acyltransferase